MCGIGAVAAARPMAGIARIAAAMAEVQRHRGPDNQSVYVSPDGRTALAHDRLSIVDLSADGSQPMANEDGSVLLVCNGEIYNHRSLRAVLEDRGHRFRSRSDSEVIVHLYEEYGTELVQHLHGMFAFAIYDSRRDLLFCARDRLGKKPLVYAQTGEGVAVASEIPAVRCFPGIDVEVDPAAMGLYLLRNVRHIPDPWTFYRGIRRLPPGHAMAVRGGQVESVWRYWSPDFTPGVVTADQVRDAFDRAVEMRRVADVEVGALLSGGVDSSAIVQAMVAQGSEGIRTYALGRDADDEELVRARRMAGLLRTEHREFYFDPDRQHEQFEHLLGIYGEPIMLLPLLYTYDLCCQVRDDGIRVVMAGHGADETFYGYSGHNDLALLSTILPFVPAVARPLLREAASRFAPGSRLREALLTAGAAPGERKAQLYRDEARRLWGSLLAVPEHAMETVLGDWLGTWMGGAAPEAYIDEACILGLMHENSHSVTIAGDLPAMAASVEVRCPFLDQELVQLAWKVPYRQKVGSLRDRSRNKLILKQAVAGRLPEDVLYAKKMGFGTHIQEDDVLRGEWKPRVDRAFRDLDSLAGVLDPDGVRALKTSFDERRGVPAAIIAKIYAALLFTAGPPSGSQTFTGAAREGGRMLQESHAAS